MIAKYAHHKQLLIINSHALETFFFQLFWLLLCVTPLYGTSTDRLTSPSIQKAFSSCPNSTLKDANLYNYYYMELIHWLLKVQFTKGMSSLKEKSFKLLESHTDGCINGWPTICILILNGAYTLCNNTGCNSTTSNSHPSNFFKSFNSHTEGCLAICTITKWSFVQLYHIQLPKIKLPSPKKCFFLTSTLRDALLHNSSSISHSNIS